MCRTLNTCLNAVPLKCTIEGALCSVACILNEAISEKHYCCCDSSRDHTVRTILETQFVLEFGILTKIELSFLFSFKINRYFYKSRDDAYRSFSNHCFKFFISFFLVH